MKPVVKSEIARTIRRVPDGQPERCKPRASFLFKHTKGLKRGNEFTIL